MKTVIMCDLDGTLCLFDRKTKNPYYRDFENDEVNTAILYILDRRDTNHNIVFVSGRSDKFRDVTEKWLRQNIWGKHNKLFMRKDGDNRKDSIVKQEIYENEIKGKYNVLFVLDDRNQVVELWRSLGLVCLQVADGDF